MPSFGPTQQQGELTAGRGLGGQNGRFPLGEFDGQKDQMAAFGQTGRRAPFVFAGVVGHLCPTAWATAWASAAS